MDVDWLALHCPKLGLELFESQDLEQPRALIEDNRVLLCNGAAERAGIRPGVTLATARSALPALDCLRRRPDLEQSRLRTLADGLYHLTPDVALAPPAALLIHLHGSRRRFDSVEALSRQAQQIGTVHGHQTRLRAGHTPLSALALALSGQRKAERVPLRVLTALNPQIHSAQVERLRNMGFQTLGQAFELPLKAMTARFGGDIALLLRQLSGQTDTPQQFIKPRAHFDETLHLLDPVRSKQGLAGPMLRLLKQLEQWLIGRQLAVSALSWRFSSGSTQLKALETQRLEASEAPRRRSARSPLPEDGATMAVRLARPLTSSRRLLRLSQTQLDTLSLPEEIIEICLTASQPEAVADESPELFADPDLPAALATGKDLPNDLLDQLCARLGTAACRQLRPVAQHHPQWLVRQPRQNRFRSKAAVKTSPQTATSSQKKVQTRPLWLCAQPRPIPESELELLNGPERIQTGWWHQGISRDYYIARRRQPQGDSYCWVFQDRDQRWYLHGYFG